MLPPGFTSREIARAGQPGRRAIRGTSSATARRRSATPDGGWVLVSNSESLAVDGRRAARRSASRPAAGSRRRTGSSPAPTPTAPAAARPGGPGSPARSSTPATCGSASRRSAGQGVDPPGARLVQPRGGDRRPGRQAALHDRGQRPTAASTASRPTPIRTSRPGGSRCCSKRAAGRAVPDPAAITRADAPAGRRHAALQRRRGDLVRRRNGLLLDQGRQPRLDLRRRRPGALGTIYDRAAAGRSAHRRRQPDACRARARSSSARTAATWRSA